MSELIDFAIEIAHAAGELTLRYFQSGLTADTKGDGTPVTIADREAENLLRTRIREAYPDDGILGEEHGEEPGTSGRIWILDPVDGTKSFVRGIPLYGTLIGIETDGVATAGVIHLPGLGETVAAAKGGGARWITGLGTPEPRERPARVSEVAAPADALMLTMSTEVFVRAGCADLVERLRTAFGQNRGHPDCYAHALVATGRAEAVVDPLMAVWDCAALQPVIEEAGGVFTDLEGRPTHRGGSAVSTNAALAGVVREIISSE